MIPVVLHQGTRPWDAPRSLTELIDLPQDVLVQLGHHVPALEVALQDLGRASTEELAEFPGPPIVRVALSFMRTVIDPREDPLAAFDILGDALRALVSEPGGAARLSVVLRYTVLTRELDVQTVADADARTPAGREPRGVDDLGQAHPRREAPR